MNRHPVFRYPQDTTQEELFQFFERITGCVVAEVSIARDNAALVTLSIKRGQIVKKMEVLDEEIAIETDKCNKDKNRVRTEIIAFVLQWFLCILEFAIPLECVCVVVSDLGNVLFIGTLVCVTSVLTVGVDCDVVVWLAEPKAAESTSCAAKQPRHKSQGDRCPSGTYASPVRCVLAERVSIVVCLVAVQSGMRAGVRALEAFVTFEDPNGLVAALDAYPNNFMQYLIQPKAKRLRGIHRVSSDACLFH